VDTRHFLIIISVAPLVILYAALGAFWLKGKIQRRASEKAAAAKRNAVTPQSGKTSQYDEPQTIWAGTSPILSKGVVVEEISAPLAERLSA